MTQFRFRLARVLEWYKKQSDLETAHLRLCAERVTRAKVDIERHANDVLAHQMELIGRPEQQGLELAYLGPFLRQAKQRELQLRRNLEKYEQDLVRQRGTCQLARRRLRLVEKLRERRLSEHESEESKELETLASDAWLARFAVNLSGNSAT